MFDIELGTLFQDLECSHDHIYQAYFSLLVNSMPKKKKYIYVLFALLLLLFFREAAKECRRRKKEYVKCLESRVAVLEVQNKKLIEELETLKDICSPKTD